MEKQVLRPKVQLDEARKKVLMKRLHKIKLNNSRNHSFLDAYNETKLRKLRDNNNSLAKSLAEQRQISNQWFEECLRAKADIHDRDQKLLRYQGIEDGHFERAVDAEMEKRLKTLAEPIEATINLSLENCLKLCSSLSKVKQLFHTLLRSNDRKINLRSSSYSRNDRGSIGSRPPLCKNGGSKSPRKNVVHPMVEGHVIGPAQICLPRVSLEDRYKYRQQERAERLEEQGNNMSAINEQSIGNNEDSTFTETIVNLPEEIETVQSNESSVALSDSEGNQTETSSSSLVQNDESNAEIAREQSPVNVNDTLACSSLCLQVSVNNADSFDSIENFMKNSSEHENSIELSKSNEKDVEVCGQRCSVDLTLNKEALSPLDVIDYIPDRSPLCKKTSRLSNNGNKNIKNFLQNCKQKTEDPLEGPSWMHLKRKRGRRGKNKTLQPFGTVRLVLEVSSDEDVDMDMETCKNKIKLPLRPTSLCLSPTKKESPLLYKPEDLETRISRRSKKKSRVNNGTGNAEEKPSNLCPLDSFIVNDSFVGESDSRVPNQPIENPVEPKLLNKERTSLFSTPQVSVNNTNNPYLVHEKEKQKLCNVTCFLNSSMEMTECLTKDLININGSETEVNEFASIDTDSPLHFIENSGKPKKFFKCSEKDNFDRTMRSLPEKTPFDASLIEPSFHFKPPSVPVQICDRSSHSTIKSELNDDSLNVGLIMEQNELTDDSFTSVIKGKENVPPIKEMTTQSDDSAPKLRNITIVVQDILKSPGAEDNVKSNSESCKSRKSSYCSTKSDSSSIAIKKRRVRSLKSLNGQKKHAGCYVKSEYLASLNVTEPNEDPLQIVEPGPKINTRRKMVVIPLVDKYVLTAKACQDVPNKKVKRKIECESKKKLLKKLNDVDCLENFENDNNSLIISPSRLKVNGELDYGKSCCLKESKCKDKILGIALSPLKLESLEINHIEENFDSLIGSTAPSGFEGFTIQERKISSAEMPLLLAKLSSTGTNVSEIAKVDIMNADKDDTIYIEPIMVDLEKEIGEEDYVVELDPLSAVQNYENFDTHTINLIGEYQPRRRRAASKIASFKEPSLWKKMRNEETKKCVIKNIKGRKRGAKVQ